MKHASSICLYNYWTDLKGSNQAPFSEAVNPSKMKNILSDVFVLDSLTKKFRLCGTRFVDIHGIELRDKSIGSLFNQADRKILNNIIEEINLNSAIVVIGLCSKTSSNEEIMSEMTLFPLINSGSISRIIGNYSPLTTPYWLGSKHIVLDTIVSYRLMYPSELSFGRLGTLKKSDEIVMSNVADVFNQEVIDKINYLQDAKKVGKFYVIDGGKNN